MHNYVNFATERPAGENCSRTTERAGREGSRRCPQRSLPARGDNSAQTRDGKDPARVTDPYGRQTLSGAGNRCLQETAGGRREQVSTA